MSAPTLPGRAPAAGAADAIGALGRLVPVVLEALAAGRADRGGPVPVGGSAAVRALIDAALGEDGVLPEHGLGDRAAVDGLVRAFAAGSADPADPACAAHLHCAPLPVAVAADLAADVLNQSVDSWDQGPAAVALERRVVAELARLAGFGSGGGVLTTGGTGSVYTALLLARDAGPGAARVYAAPTAHFCVERGADMLGLPRTTVPVDADRRLAVPRLAELLGQAPADERPVVVATAGTTDLGIVDPLAAVAELVHGRGGWLHVDAAYGGGLLFSERRRGLLAGIEDADSVGLDLHKFGWVPAAAGLLLTRRAGAFDPLRRRAAYLNPADDETAGYTALLGQSLRTTRRADALKVAAVLRALGRVGLGARVDACCDLAAAVADRVAARPEFDLTARPALSTVLFRYRTADPDRSDEVNALLRRELLSEGRAVVGRTELDGAAHLKLTLLNPDTTTAEMDAVLDAVLDAGRRVEARMGGRR